MEFGKQFKIFLIVICIIFFILLINSSILYIKKPKIIKKEGFKNEDKSDSECDKDNNSKNEKFIKKSIGLKIQYLDKEEAFFFFQNLDYLDTMNHLNVKLRNNMNPNKNHLVRKYTQSLLDFYVNDKKILTKLFNNILSKEINHYNKEIFRDFISMMIPKIYFAKMKDSFEGGMPHTHKNIVFLPESFFNIDLSSNTKKIESTLIHEIFHIYQRMLFKIDKERIHNFYSNLNFIKVDYIHNFENIIEINRHNPDGLDLKWVLYDPDYDSYYWIGAVFSNNNSKTIKDVEYLAFPLTKINESKFKYEEIEKSILLNKFTQFNNFFGIENNHYHPNEITAQYLENLYLGDNIKSDGYHKFKNKIDSLLK